MHWPNVSPSLVWVEHQTQSLSGGGESTELGAHEKQLEREEQGEKEPDTKTSREEQRRTEGGEMHEED